MVRSANQSSTSASDALREGNEHRTDVPRDAPRYVPLWTKSNYSFLEGASHPEELVQRARELGLSALALTDRHGVYGVVRAHMAAIEKGAAPLRVIVGAEVTLDSELRVVLLAQTRAGYGRITRLLTLGHARAKTKGEARVTIDELREQAAEEVILLAPCAETVTAFGESHRGQIYALVTRHLEPEEPAREQSLRRAAELFDVPTVAAVEVVYHSRARQPLQDVLTCVRHGTTLMQAGTRLHVNAERELLSIEAIYKRFSDDPESVLKTLEVAERCTFEMSQLRYVYPEERVPDGETSQSWLRTLTHSGAQKRYPDGVPKDVNLQLEKELSLIEELQYGGYFLTMWDVVRFCREKNILCQGRGSAANSAVCFCLGITAIDPVRMDLLFERFLSRERAEPPDIDIDIEHERREEVIQYVYERWGRRRAAMVANVIRYRVKSALRDVGKVLGVAEIALDRASKVLSHRGQIDAKVVEEMGLHLEAASTRHLIALVTQLQDFPRHLGIHPGGFLLGHEEVDTFCPVEPATMPGRTVVQWDKQDVEDLGLFKVDLLGLGALTVIHRCFDLLREHDEIDLEIATVPAEDPITYSMCSRGDTVGVFQIESRAQMAMLPRLRPRTFYDLVIEVAIVRPGPIQGDMVHPYLRRREGTEAVEFPHPMLERVLKRTLGVPIFQEQVMKLAVLAAGYTPGEADQLRRDMAAWRSKGRIEQHREKLISRMTQDGIPLEFAERVFQQIRGFGEYGFPESHAASFALLAYVTAWLKCHHPAAFVCAMLNAWPMGFYHPSTLVDDAKRHRVVVLPIDVQRSRWECTLEPVPRQHWGVRMGLRYVKGLTQQDKDSIFEAGKEGPYVDLEDFVRRTGLSKKSLDALAKAGAFATLTHERRSAIWELARLAKEVPLGLRFGVEETAPRSRSGLFPKLPRIEAIAWDYRASLHSTLGHPIEGFREVLTERGIPEARIVSRMRDGQGVRYAGLVICRQRPGTATGVVFMTLEDETGFVNVVVWNTVFAKFEVVAKTASLLEVRGRVQRESGVVHLIADSLAELSASELLGIDKSRDFH